MEREARQQERSPGVGCSRARLLTRAERTFSQATRGRNARAAFPTDTSRGWAVSAADCSAQTARAAQTHSAAAGSTHAGEAALSLRVRNRPWLRKDTAQDMGLVLSFGLQMKASNLAGRRHNYRRIIFVTCYKQKLY